MSSTSETRRTTGRITGTVDKTYDLIWFAEARMNNALRLEPTSTMRRGPATRSSRTLSAKRRA